jgi:hypothetical protein
MSTSRWLTWIPDGSAMGKTSETELPKPTESSFGGSDGTFSGVSPVISTSPTFTQSQETPSPKERNAARVLVLCWLRARCTQSWQAWGSEKSLWYDYCAWCDQRKQSACRGEFFCEAMNETFCRDGAGWQGVCLRSDFAASKYVM